MISRGLPIFERFCKLLRNVVTETFAEPAANWLSLVKSILLLYVCQISDSIFDVWFPTCQFYPSNCDITRPPSFRKFLQTAEECCTRTFGELSQNWGVSSNRSLTGTVSIPSCPFICVNLVIHDLTSGFRPVCSTRQNVISRGLPIFGSFCRPLRNFVT